MVNCSHMSNVIGAFVPVTKDFATMTRPVSADTANKIIIHTNALGIDRASRRETRLSEPFRSRHQTRFTT